jgi:hypothetical protein
MDQKEMGQPLFPSIGIIQSESILGGKQQHAKDQGHEIGRVDPEKTANKKSPPFPPLLFKAQVDAETADHEEDRNTGCPAKISRRQEELPQVWWELAKPSVPRQLIIPMRVAEQVL